MDRSNWTYYNTYHYYGQPYPEAGQHTSQPEAGQTSAGIPVSGASGNQPAPGQPQPYLNPNTPMLIPPSPGADLEYLLHTPQPTAEEGVIPDDALPESSNLQPAARACRRKPRVKRLPPAKERFLAGLDAYERGALLKDCSETLPFTEYIKNDGSLIKKGIPLYQKLTDAEKARLDQAIIGRQGAKFAQPTDKGAFLAGLDNYAQGVKLSDCSTTIEFRFYASDNGRLYSRGKEVYADLSEQDQARVDQALLARNQVYRERSTVAKRFLAGLDNYAQGVPLRYCSATLSYSSYIADDGHLQKQGKEMYAGLSAEDQGRVNQAILSRCQAHYEWLAEDDTVAKRFLAGLDKYAQGVPLKYCSETLPYRNYASDDGHLQKQGKELYECLSKEDQAWVNQALLSRNKERSTLTKRFLASLDDYARGVSIRECSKGIQLNQCVTHDGFLQPRGESIYDSLSKEDKMRVDRALTARGKIVTQSTSADVHKFMDTLEPYGNGRSLEECGKEFGLNKRVGTYLTQEGGLTPRGRRLIENLQPYQQIDVWFAIEKRRQLTNPIGQEPGSPWLPPEMPSSMPELGGMNPTEMTDPMQTEVMQTEAMHFQHRYDSNGLMPQSAPDRLIGRGIEDRMLINILGEEYRVHYTGSSGNPTNENPYGNQFMLVPRMRGG
ncbi:MAG: hypothetical protein P8X74_13270 [Reinekea sp.]